mmetsp:Transcript_35393/g.86588  ORF Transcript_35393/g.86588 Transcript_35393/m.86588 type:complete len:341 (+) Transcript_35393:544-1566(+)
MIRFSGRRKSCRFLECERLHFAWGDGIVAGSGSLVEALVAVCALQTRHLGPPKGAPTFLLPACRLPHRGVHCGVYTLATARESRAARHRKSRRLTTGLPTQIRKRHATAATPLFGVHPHGVPAHGIGERWQSVRLGGGSHGAPDAPLAIGLPLERRCRPALGNVRFVLCWARTCRSCHVRHVTFCGKLLARSSKPNARRRGAPTGFCCRHVPDRSIGCRVFNTLRYSPTKRRRGCSGSADSRGRVRGCPIVCSWPTPSFGRPGSGEPDQQGAGGAWRSSRCGPHVVGSRTGRLMLEPWRSQSGRLRKPCRWATLAEAATNVVGARVPMARQHRNTTQKKN